MMPARDALTSRIAGIAHWVPERVVTSAWLEDELGLNDRCRLPRGFLAFATGVRERRWSEPGTANSDLASKAARGAMDRAGVKAEDIDCLIFAACGQDITEPATANIIQDLLGAVNAHVMDVKNACNSWLNAVDIMHAFICLGRVRCGLVVTGELGSFVQNREIADQADLVRSLAGLTLGDGGAAAVMVPSPNGRGIQSSYFKSDGSKWDLATINGGGTRFGWGTQKFESRSAELLALAVEQLSPSIRAAADKVGWTLEEVDLFVPHQVSQQLAEQLCRRMNVSFDRCAMTIERFGNCAAASVPITLSVAAESGRLKPGDKVMLIGGAAGFSSAVITMIW